MKVDFYNHGLNESHAAEVAKVLASEFLTTGEICRAVEQQINRYFDCEFCTLTNSWTNGAVAALLALDIGPGDEVIVPAMTFVATANIVELVGATPIFCDVDPNTLLIDIEQVSSHITNRTKAIIPVHLYGQMVDIKLLKSQLGSSANRVDIIEDCAHCFEGRFDNYKPGTFSKCAIFSFYATKNITCGEGGAVISNCKDFHSEFLKTKQHGMSASAAERFQAGRYNHWDVDRLGTKANLPDLLACLLPHQIATIDEVNTKRRAIHDKYIDAFKSLDLRTPKLDGRCISAYHLFPIHVGEGLRDKLIEHLNFQQIGCTVNYSSVPNLTYYKTKYHFQFDDYPISSWWGCGTLSIPLYPSMESLKQEKVVEAICDFFTKAPQAKILNSL